MKLVARLFFVVLALALATPPMLLLAKFLLTLLINASAIQLFMGASIIASSITAFAFKRPFSALAMMGAATILACTSSLLLAAAVAYPTQFALACYSAVIIGGLSLLHILAPRATPRRPNRFDNILMQEPPFTSIRNTINQHRRRHPDTNFVPPPTFTPSANARRFAPPATETLPPNNTFQSRLDAIGRKGDLQEDFYDPITTNLMEDPVNAITEILNPKGTVLQVVNYILDKSTYESLKRLPCGRREQPNNRLPILRCIPCDDMKASIDLIITHLESEYHLNQADLERTTVRA